MGKYTTIDDPSAYFQVATYTGAGANQTVTNDGNSDLQPDFLWIKRRNAAYAHALFDSNRGLGSSNPPMLESDSTAAENSNQNWISGVGTDSFTIGINEQNLSNTSGTYVAWQWKVNGGTTSSNTSGGITTTVQANTDAGFSIVTYTGDGATSQTVGHGLGAVPKMIISKDRGSTSNVPNWRVYHEGIGNTKYLQLDGTGAAGTFDDWGNTTPTSSVYTIGGSGGYRPTNTNNANYVAYVFAEKQGYSKFGKYKGNGNADGAFVYLGFAPAWLLIKRFDAGVTNWNLYDNRRESSGGGFADRQDASRRLFPNNTEAESANTVADEMQFTSNGFKLRGTQGSLNGSGNEFIYMAFAENPFVTSTGIPTTAR